MNLSTPVETPHVDSLRALSVTEIDREVASLTEALDHVTHADLAVAFEQRRQALLAARVMAAVRERIRARDQRAEAARAARTRFDALEAELRPVLQAQAVALDAWVVAGAELVSVYRSTAQRVGELHDVLLPPQPGHELHLLGPFERLARIEKSLEEALVRSGVLPHIDLSAFARDPSQTLEAHVVGAMQRMFNEARLRLPPAPDDTAEESGI